MKNFNLFISVLLSIFFYINSGFCRAQELEFTITSPQYNGGLKALKEFITLNLKYPEEAKQKGTCGVVTLSYLINEQGKINDIKILRGLETSLDSEAVRVTSLISGWKPAIQFGKPVPVRVIMPVDFKSDQQNTNNGSPIRISGTVTDKQTGRPVEGTLVLVKGTNEGAITDKNGFYALNAQNEKSELDFSCMGYSNKITKVEKNRTINMELQKTDLVIDFEANEFR